LNLRPPGYEPGELPDCSTPRRETQDTIVSVPWWTSLAVAFFALALVFAAIVGVIGFIRVRRFARAGEGIAAALDELSGRTVELEERLARLDERSVEIERAAERVNRSLERLSVLTWALGDARKGIARIRAVARK
jgi:hypothetical protein